MDLREEIARAAYYLYERSGWLHGRDEEHWLEAERSVMGRLEQRAGEAVRDTAVDAPPATRKNKAIKRRVKPGAKPGAKARPSGRPYRFYEVLGECRD